MLQLLLLDSQACINLLDGTGNNALHWTTVNGHDEVRNVVIAL